MDCCSPYIICICIILPYSTGYKCQNMPSIFACSHSVRLHGWLGVNIFLFTAAYTRGKLLFPKYGVSDEKTLKKRVFLYHMLLLKFYYTLLWFGIFIFTRNWLIVAIFRFQVATKCEEGLPSYNLLCIICRSDSICFWVFFQVRAWTCAWYGYKVTI